MHPFGRPRHVRSRLVFAAAVVSFWFNASTAILFAQAALPAPTPTASEADADSAIKPETKQEVVALDKLVVSGIRLGIEDAIVTKRETVAVVEAISAEDVGKLPDVSIAESIARLPGLAAQRVAGRAQVISVRGLSPDFATTLLNGREQVSTGDNRGVEFDQYPSELINSVTVYKTPDAALVGQGLSGTFDLRTIRPLSFGRRTLAFNLRGERGSLGDLGSDSNSTGHRFSGTYIDQFAKKTVGLALGYAHLESPIAAKEFGTYGWNTNSRPGIPAGTNLTDGQKIFARSGKNIRDGVIGILQWRPSQNWSSVIDAYYSKFKHQETNRGLETNFGNFNGGLTPGLNYTTPVIVDNTLLGGVASGLYPLVRNIYNNRVDKLTAAGWNNEYRWEKWTLVGDVSYSKAERNELNLETQAQYHDASGQPVLDTATFNLATGDFPTTSYTLDYTDPARIQIGPTLYGAGYGKVPMIKDVLTSYKGAATYALSGVFESVDVGFNYGDRTKNKRQPEASLDSGNFQPLSTAVLFAPAHLGFANAPSVLSWDVPKVLGAYYAPFAPSDRAFGYLIQKTWKVAEKISTSFVKLNLGTDWGPVHVKGNAGVQVKATDQSSTSNYFDNAATAGSQIKVNHDGKEYTDVLPSGILVFEFPHDQVVRLAAAKQIARPRLDQLKSSLEFDISRTDGLPSGNGGNPRLDPWRANALDLSYESYFAQKKGYIALAGFYKKLKTYIFDQTDPDYDFSRFTAGSPIASTSFGRFTQPLNGQGGRLSGAELSVSVPLSLVASFLDGFGVVASVTQTSSAITIDNTNLGNTVTLPGLSKTVSNATLYYEKHGFSTRISQRYRSDFVGEISGFGSDRELRFVRGESVTDFQVGYEFGRGSLKGVGVQLQIYNLTDAPYQTYQTKKSQIVEYQKYGRTILLGVNYRL